MNIQVKDLVGENCLTVDDGQKVFQAAHPVLKAGSDIQLDFSGTSVFASPFFNAAVGQLLRDISPEALNRLLTIRGLPPNGEFVLRRVIENAKEYYTDARTKDAVDAARSSAEREQ